VDLPGSVLKSSPANQFNLRTKDLVAKEENDLHDLPKAFARGKMQFWFLDRFVRACFNVCKKFLKFKKA
jgi:hypothetical protein